MWTLKLCIQVENKFILIIQLTRYYLKLNYIMVKNTHTLAGNSYGVFFSR